MHIMIFRKSLLKKKIFFFGSFTPQFLYRPCRYIGKGVGFFVPQLGLS